MENIKALFISGGAGCLPSTVLELFVWNSDTSGDPRLSKIRHY